MMPQKLTRPDFPGRYDKDELATFQAALKKAISAPHSAIKAQLDAEQRVGGTPAEAGFSAETHGVVSRPIPTVISMP